MGTNQDYKNRSLEVHRGNWAPALVATIVFIAVAIICSGGSNLPPSVVSTAVLGWLALGSSILSVFILLPLQMGFMNTFMIQLEAGDNELTRNMFRVGFSENYFHNVWAMFLMGFKTFLWSLLLLIPGFVKAYAYFLTPFIIAENPEMKAIDAIHLSQDMMRGHKFDLFYLEISFLGWILLSILTLCIGLLWVIPYMQTAMAAFYLDVKAEYQARISQEQ